MSRINFRGVRLLSWTNALGSRIEQKGGVSGNLIEENPYEILNGSGVFLWDGIEFTGRASSSFHSGRVGLEVIVIPRRRVLGASAAMTLGLSGLGSGLLRGQVIGPEAITDRGSNPGPTPERIHHLLEAIRSDGERLPGDDRCDRSRW